MADLAMSSGAAGKVLGPRPGKAACSFKAGVGEIVLRIVNGVVAIFPIITGVLLIAFTADAATSSGEGADASSSNNVSSTAEAIAYTSGVVTLSGGALVLVWAIVMLILRFLNIGLLNLGSKYFLSVDVVIHFILAAVLIAGVAISIVTAVEWTDNEDVCGAAIASIIANFVSGVLTVVLAVYMIIYIVKEFNDEIVKYTIKEAITG